MRDYTLTLLPYMGNHTSIYHPSCIAQKRYGMVCVYEYVSGDPRRYAVNQYMADRSKLNKEVYRQNVKHVYKSFDDLWWVHGKEFDTLNQTLEKDPFVYCILANQAYYKARLAENGPNNHVVLYYYEYVKASCKMEVSSKRLKESLV